MSKVTLEPIAPEAAIAFLREKGLIGPNGRYSYLDTFRQEHARNFTVAKAMRDEVLTVLQRGVEEVLTEGQTLPVFIEKLQPQLERLGWWGKGMVVDSNTGMLEVVQLGSKRRLQVIFDSNIRAAHAAGRWQRIQASKDAFPFLQYRQRDRITKREEHTRYDGLVLPVDHPAWRKIYPPNGYFCACHVRQISQAMMEREGLTVSEGFELEEAPFINPRTGERVDVPIGIDPSWSSNAGADRLNP